MATPLPRIALTAGEPAGIGPDLCLAVAARAWPAELVVFADPDLLARRREALGAEVKLEDPGPGQSGSRHQPGTLRVAPVELRAAVVPGQLEPRNAPYVLETLDAATEACPEGRFDALVTAPVQKSTINEAGIAFSGHTEYLAARTGGGTPVMLLVAGTLRVALATTHLPLREVSDRITPERLAAVLRVLDADLRRRFALPAPRILVCGLNPHAGESGHLGHEELEVIAPTLDKLRAGGLDLVGPVPADTAFTPSLLDGTDAVLAMYHDQGLPVLKYAGFGSAVNVTLGLPIVRTSVDHGTALDLAATGRADPGSLEAAIELAIQLCRPGAPA